MDNSIHAEIGHKYFLGYITDFQHSYKDKTTKAVNFTIFISREDGPLSFCGLCTLLVLCFSYDIVYLLIVTLSLLCCMVEDIYYPAQMNNKIIDFELQICSL